MNARFFELKLRQPFGAAAERQLREGLAKRLGRGRVDLSISVRGGEDEELGPDGACAQTAVDPLSALGIDPSHVDRVLRAVAELEQRAHGTLEVRHCNAADLLNICLSPTRISGLDRPASTPDFLEILVGRAIDALLVFRSREGAALAAAIEKLAAELEAQVASLSATLAPEGVRLAQRIEGRLIELTARLAGEGSPTDAVDPDRVAQEVAVVIARGDVTEELDRIGSHLAQLDEVLAGDATSGQGKTLEFLAQELFREITTIGSKITSHEGSRIVIEAKGTVERIREQVHNVE